jgi:DNA-binding winged helix-turn-helix (wHTH) protein/tetratricopeptide (TPR) repeat protein
MSLSFSKEIQSRTDTAYRFGDFALFPVDRVLKRGSTSIPLQPRAFDALLCFVRRAGHLVSKRELVETIWPGIHVKETNLTNVIVTLRKVIGRDAIRTVSKHGYCFDAAVIGEPSVPISTYERFIRAKELVKNRSLEQMYPARDLLWTCLAEDPDFAPAWAWLGRCCWFLEKYAGGSMTTADLATAAFERSFALDPDLAASHQFYTLVQVDTGRADEAMNRLFARLQRHPGEPESFAGLVHVLRFRGLLKESLAAHQRAIRLDPSTTTSVAPTYFFLGNYGAAIETYKSGRAAYYLDAAAWAALGDEERATALLRDRLQKLNLSGLIAALLRSLLAIMEHQSGKAGRIMRAIESTRDPEILMFFARHYSRAGFSDSAIAALKQAFQGGFVCSPETLKSDPWLHPIHDHPEFISLLRESYTLVKQARTDFMAHIKQPGMWEI